MDLEYIKHEVNEDSILKSTEHSLVSFEKLRADRLLSLLEFLKYKVHKHDLGESIIEDKETLRIFNNNIKLFNIMLNSMEKKNSFLCL